MSVTTACRYLGSSPSCRPLTYWNAHSPERYRSSPVTSCPLPHRGSLTRFMRANHFDQDGELSCALRAARAVLIWWYGEARTDEGFVLIADVRTAAAATATTATTAFTATATTATTTTATTTAAAYLARLIGERAGGTGHHLPPIDVGWTIGARKVERWDFLGRAMHHARLRTCRAGVLHMAVLCEGPTA